MSWDKVGEMLKELDSGSGGGSNDYISLKDGDSVEVVFLGEPLCFYKIFQDRREFQNYVEGSSFRFKINCAVGNKVKLFEGGRKVLKSIHASIVRYGQDCLYEIKREGSGKENTSYHVFFVRKLEAAEIKKLKSLETFELYVMSEDKKSKKKEIQDEFINDANEEMDEEAELRAKTADAIISLVGSSAKDMQDFMQMNTEWRDKVTGEIKQSGVREPAKLSYVVKPGKTKSQAQFLYDKISVMTKADAIADLEEWRKNR